jgi:pyruvate,orthophosphate dikinase
MGKPCVVGCTDIRRGLRARALLRGDEVVRKGHVDHHRRRHRRGHGGQGRDPAPATDSAPCPRCSAGPTPVARLKVRANADTGNDAKRARQLGALGIGLCRTEHMFFQPDALRAMRQMILAEDRRSRQRALKPGPADPARRCSARSSRRWTACPSPSACSTRRCTSSCRRARGHLLGG